MKEHQDGMYQGQLNSKSQKNGLGIYLWDAGYAYYGEWKNDQIDGQGILFLGGQIIIQGGFRKGVPQGYLVIKVENRVFYCQFDKGEAIFIQEGEKRIIVEQSTAQITHDCTEEADRILQSISKLSSGDLQIQLFNHCLHYGAVGKADLPHGLGVEISNLYFQCGQFVDGKIHGIGRLEQSEEIYQGSFSQGKYHGNGLFVFKDERVQWIKGVYKQGQLMEIKKTGFLNQLSTPQELVFSFSKKNNNLYTVIPISKEIISGYIRLFQVMQFVRLRVNTLSEVKQHTLQGTRKYSTNTNVLSKSVEEIKLLQSQFNTRNIEQQNQIYQIILNQHDENETQRKTDTQQSRMKTQPAEEFCDNKISFGMLDVPNLKESRKTAIFTSDDVVKRSQSQNEVPQKSNNDRMLTLKNILEAQKQKYYPEQKKTVFTEIQTSTASKSKAILSSQHKNLKSLSEVVQRELNHSPSDERRSTIKPIYIQNDEPDASSQKTLSSKFTTDYTTTFTQHKNKIHSLLNKFNNIKIKPISQECPNMEQALKSTSSKQSIQRVYENTSNALTNIQNQISLVSHQNQQNLEQNQYLSVDKRQSKKMEESRYQSQCGNGTQTNFNEDQNSKYILEIRQELAEQKQMLAKLFESLKQQTPIKQPEIKPQVKRYANTPQRQVQIHKQIFLHKGIYPAFTIVKSVSPVRL